jgi:glycosyltransferase involved in cell wall biosynthesis
VNPSVIDDRGDTEGLGVGAIEAYMHGKPVVASAVGGIPDAVRNGTTGWLVPEKDTAALAIAILDLVKDPAKARKFGEAGLRFAEQRFDWERITDRLEQIYYATTKANVATTRRPFSASPPRNVEYTFSP